MDKWQTNIDPKSEKKIPKRHPGTENWPQEGRTWHPKRPKIVPRRAEEGAKTIPNRKSNQEAHQDYPKTVLGLPHGAIRPFLPHLLGYIWTSQNDPKRNRKRYKIEAKNQEPQKPIQDDLGPVLGRSWAVLGAILGRPGPQNRAVAQVALTFSKNRFFDVKTVGRRLWDQLWPTKAPK